MDRSKEYARANRNKGALGKVREVEKSVAQGRKTKRGYMHPLSGFLLCADCVAR